MSDEPVAAPAQDRPDRDREDPTSGVRSVLAEIGAEETIADLESRVAGLEQDLGRQRERAQQVERARQGELEVMRARVADALQVVRDAVDEQRGAWSRLEERLAELSQEARTQTEQVAASLRDDLGPRVHAAVLRTDEAQARLDGEIEALGEQLRARLEQLAEQVADVRRGAAQRTDAIEDRLATDLEALGTGLDEHVRRSEQRFEQLAGDAERARTDLADRVEALRRELDAAAGELRAGWHLRAQELEERTEALRTQVEAAVDQRETEALEQRWADGTRELSRRIDELAGVIRSTVDQERAGREDAVAALDDRLREVTAAVAALEDQRDTNDTRRLADLEQLRRAVEELRSGHGRLEEQVGAVGPSATDLANRIAGTAAQVEAIREAAVRQEQRLSGVDGLPARLEALERQLEERRERDEQAALRERLDQVQQGMSSLRRDLATLAGGVEDSIAQSATVREQLSPMQDAVRAQEALRHEVRELAARSAELAARVAEVERVARRGTSGAAGPRTGEPQEPTTAEPTTTAEEPAEPEPTTPQAAPSQPPPAPASPARPGQREGSGPATGFTANRPLFPPRSRPGDDDG